MYVDRYLRKEIIETWKENLRKTRIGKVISNKMDKTIVVAIEDNVKHPLYGRSLRELTS